MTIRHVRVMPQAYTIEPRPVGLVGVCLCRQVDTYMIGDGVRAFDVDIRVMCGIPVAALNVSDIRARFESWWDAAGAGAA